MLKQCTSNCISKPPTARRSGKAAGQRQWGVLCSNPIGASWMLRFAEAARQVMGTAEEHQVDGVRRTLGHAYGGGSQFYFMWVVGTEKAGTR